MLQRDSSEDDAINEDPNATDPQGSQMGNQLQQAINRALGTVDNVLSYGRKLHGLGGGGDDEGAIKGTEVAGRMPSVPGTSSDSGVMRPQPTPGPLPPTSNPFGKRQQFSDAGGAQEDNDGDDDQSGAIDTGEEETA